MREYAGPDDLLAMQGLVQRTWTVGSKWHIGDLAWQRNSIPGQEAGWRTALWEQDDQATAWGWAELPGHLDLAVDPGRPGLAAEVIAWFEQVGESEHRSCTVLETESHLVSALEGAGYSPDPRAPYLTHHHLLLADADQPVPPDGFTLRHVRLDEAEARGAGHRAAWSDLVPSKMTTDSYRHVMAAGPYRPELDWVIEDREGNFVATALGWLDVHNRVGLLEPVGCAPAYRRRGFARAVNLACLQAMREAGADRAVVCPRGDEGYPIPGKLYRSIGFRPGARTVTYIRR